MYLARSDPFSFCRFRPLLLLNRYNSKQPISWFTTPCQRSLLEKYLTTSAATGNQTRVSRLHVQRADHYTMAAEWLQIQFRLVRNPQEDRGSNTCLVMIASVKSNCTAESSAFEQHHRDNVCSNDRGVKASV